MSLFLIGIVLPALIRALMVRRPVCQGFISPESIHEGLCSDVILLISNAGFQILGAERDHEILLIFSYLRD
jgi:hypothetical protein